MLLNIESRRGRHYSGIIVNQAVQSNPSISLSIKINQSRCSFHTSIASVIIQVSVLIRPVHS